MKKLLPSKILAAFGTLLVWLPFLGMLVTSFYGFLGRGRLNVDFLAPAEFFVMILAGAMLLIWAAAREKIRLAQVLLTFGISMAFLFLGQAIAVWTGLAAGRIQDGGWQSGLVMGMLIAYDVAAVILGVIGVLLYRDIKRNEEKNHHQ